MLSAEITTSGYRLDDRLDSVIDVIEPVKVLIVSGDERPGAFRSEVDFLRWALAPHQAAHRAGADPCSVEVVPVEQWTGADLEKYQVAILANIERFYDAAGAGDRAIRLQRRAAAHRSRQSHAHRGIQRHALERRRGHPAGGAGGIDVGRWLPGHLAARL